METPRIGCSGWNYAAWRGAFYPVGLPPAKWLEYYVQYFDTVELNNSFYRLPERETFASWERRVPADFVFAVKASRFLTHMKRLRDPAAPIERLLSRVEALGRRLGPILYQLPGSMTRDVERLRTFLAVLPRTLHGQGLRHVIEFRHPSWYVEDILALLEHHEVAICLHDKQGSAIAESRVGPFMYARFHGTSGMYRGSYDRTALEPWADRLAAEAGAGRAVYAYFNNDPDAVAVANARELRQMVFSRLGLDERAAPIA
jgi:uncharacterized protein YecE (DUF72 family)